MFRDGTVAVADHQAAAGCATYVYMGQAYDSANSATIRHFA